MEKLTVACKASNYTNPEFVLYPNRTDNCRKELKKVFGIKIYEFFISSLLIVRYSLKQDS